MSVAYLSTAILYATEDRNFYRVFEALGVENDRCILVLAAHEPVSRGHGIVAA